MAETEFYRLRTDNFYATRLYMPADDKLEKWANHIMERFKGENLEWYVYGRYLCPCKCFNWDCRTCEHSKNTHFSDLNYQLGCGEAIKFGYLTVPEIERIKDIIIEKLKGE